MYFYHFIKECLICYASHVVRFINWSFIFIIIIVVVVVIESQTLMRHNYRIHAARSELTKGFNKVVYGCFWRSL